MGKLKDVINIFFENKNGSSLGHFEVEGTGRS